MQDQAVNGVGILLLAAGVSQRYQQATGQHKLLVRLPDGHEETIFEHSLKCALQVNEANWVHVVLRPESTDLIKICQQYECSTTIIESDGLGTSIVAGVKACANWSGWLIMLADMPYIKSKTIQQVKEALKEQNTARPIWQNIPAHPVGFSNALYKALIELRGDDGAKVLLKKFPPFLIKTTDEGSVWDIDLPEDLICPNPTSKL